MNERYVVLVKANGRYMPDMELASNELFVAQCDFEDAYMQLDQILADQGGGIGSVTLFDREQDVDLKYMCLTRYHREVQ